jgi:peptide deformylase
MVRAIVRDELFLKQRSEIATKADATIIVDLIDTLRANQEHCVGMAANMIGVKKRIIVFSFGIDIAPMVNPVITKKQNPYETEEGCLSLTGVRKTMRYDRIEVEYEDQNFKKQKQTFQGWVAQIIQHEVDHLEGIII